MPVGQPEDRATVGTDPSAALEAGAGEGRKNPSQFFHKSSPNSRFAIGRYLPTKKIVWLLDWLLIEPLKIFLANASEPVALLERKEECNG
jgi:hypothetical protein